MMKADNEGNECLRQAEQDLEDEVAHRASSIARRPWIARMRVISSAYSRSPPTGRPRAMRVIGHVVGEPVGEVGGGGVALQGGVGGEDHLGIGTPACSADDARQQLADPQALGPDAVHRADRAVQDVIAPAPLPGALDREHVEGLLDDAERVGVASRVATDRAGGRRR